MFSRVGGEEISTVQQGWKRKDVQCSAGLEEKRCSLFSRVSLRKKIKDGERLERLNGTDFILPPLLGILNLTNLK